MQRALLGVALALALTATASPAQHPPAVSRFVDGARHGSRRYQSQTNAIADGFKRVGVEFPAMGEHWVNMQRIMEDTLAPERPSVLIYVNVDGEARLAGVGYTALLRPGEQPPEFAPARHFWHEHNGTVADESFPLAHHLVGTPSHENPGTSLRLSILHAWIWTPNVDGVFATDNWSLPPLRIGVAANPLPHDALRAMALASDSTDYYALMIRTGVESAGNPLSASEERDVMRVLADHRARAATVVALLRGGDQVSGDMVARLSATWASLWAGLERTLPSRVSVLRTLRGHL